MEFHQHVLSTFKLVNCRFHRDDSPNPFELTCLDSAVKNKELFKNLKPGFESVCIMGPPFIPLSMVLKHLSSALLCRPSSSFCLCPWCWNDQNLPLSVSFCIFLWLFVSQRLIFQLETRVATRMLCTSDPHRFTSASFYDLKVQYARIGLEFILQINTRQHMIRVTTAANCSYR